MTSFRRSINNKDKPQPHLKFASKINPKMRSSLAKRALSTLPSAHPRSPSAHPRSRYVPQKRKDEMAALADEDASRWTATTLAKRFDVAPENVAAILRLRRLRGPADEDGVARLREQVRDAWAGLAEVVDRSGPARLAAVAPEVEVVPAGETEGEAEEEVEVEVEVVEEVCAKSKTAVWVESEGGKAARDTVRRNSFAFIEVGVAKDVDGAVWIREGSTGALRAADAEERKALLQQCRVDQTTAWQ